MDTEKALFSRLFVYIQLATYFKEFFFRSLTGFEKAETMVLHHVKCGFALRTHTMYQTVSGQIVLNCDSTQF